MICWATWSPRPGRELEAKPALANSLKGRAKMRKLSKKTLAVAITVALLSGGGAAFAYWSAGGTGTGTAASAATATATVSVNQSTTPITGLTPGGPFISLDGTLTNSTTGPLRVTSLTAAVTGVDVGHSSCVFADYKITGTAVLANLVSGDVPVGSIATWSGLKINLANTAVSQDSCKGATVTITYTAL